VPRRERKTPEEIRILQLLAGWERENRRRSLVVPPALLTQEGTPAPRSMAELIRQIESACKAKETPILKEDFKDVDYLTLKTLRRVGHHCYTLRELFSTIKQSIEQNQPVRDPLTRERWPQSFQDDVLRQYQRLVSPVATLTPPVIPFEEKKVALEFLPIEVKLPARTLDFWHVQVAIPSLQQILDLGYIPEFQDPRDVSNNTGVLLSSLHQLWAKRRLLSTHSPLESIACCQVHLGKPIDYWILPTGEINGEFVRKMGEELKDLL
jgi:hypothetical protein